MMRFWQHPLVLIVATIGFILISSTFYTNGRQNRISTEQSDVLEQEITEMAREVSDLENQLRVATSSGAQEKLLRDQLLLQKPGEYVVQLPDIEVTPPPPVTPTPAPTAWQEWQKVLF